MDRVLLDYLINLFAFSTSIYPGILFDNAKDYFISFVLKDFSFSTINESLEKFKFKFTNYSEIRIKEGINNLEPLIKSTILRKEIDLNQNQKFYILSRLLLFEKNLIKFELLYSESQELFEKILTHFIENEKINKISFLCLREFIKGAIYNIPDRQTVLVIGESKFKNLNLQSVLNDGLTGYLFFHYIKEANLLLFFYKGDSLLLHNGTPLFNNYTYTLKKGSAIKGENIKPIYYNQVIKNFSKQNTKDICIDVQGLEYKFPKSTNGIQNLNITLETGQLIGIIGRAGVGKSTLINILAGILRPHSGSVKYNDTDLFPVSPALRSIIGYVQQDDFLIEELTVFNNLYYSALLCLGNYTNKEIYQKVIQLLANLDLLTIKDLKVGNALNKSISGGQRKKLNIALELIREPLVLFLDEPTSGLSSSDTEDIMHNLSELSINGKLVVANIHQPSSDVFKLFDKIILIDKGGYTIYFGNPTDSIAYFNSFNEKLSTTIDFCHVCENINPENIFKAIEERKVNELGVYTDERKVAPVEWHQRFLKSNNKDNNNDLKGLPEPSYHTPKTLNQFWLLFKRNLVSKITDIQYILLALLITPILAIILSTLCKSVDKVHHSYIFVNNDNIPAFFFMSVIVALFVGLVMSANEIIKDRKSIYRESFLGISKLAYLNSKVLYNLLLSSFQAFTFLTISYTILEIKDMFWISWVILLTVLLFANLLGLLISTVFRTSGAIYILVPLIIVPQILLSGVVISYDKLNDKVTSYEYVPVIGDLMASRWAYEALVVEQFANNSYQKGLFETEKRESNEKFKYLIIIPEIRKALFELKKVDNPLKEQKYKFAFNGLEQLGVGDDILNKYVTNNEPPSHDFFNWAKRYLDSLSVATKKKLDYLQQLKGSLTQSLINSNGGIDGFVKLKQNYTNKAIIELSLNRSTLKSFYTYNNKIIRELEPIYKTPTSKMGRSHFISSEKRIGNHTIYTSLFNVLIIMFMSLIIYLFLLILFSFSERR